MRRNLMPYVYLNAAAMLLGVSFAQGRPSERVTGVVGGRTPREFQAMLDERRAASVSQDLRSLVLSSLPRQGRVTKLTQTAERKLASVDRVLTFHDRKSQYEMVIIDTPQAIVALHARTVVLVSEAALALLQTEEFQALVAHEAGHEYVWDDFLRAQERKDSRTLRELELWCDAVAVLTLRRADMNPASLVSALRKLRVYNLQHFGRALNEDSYPGLDEREWMLRQLVAWAAE